MVEMSEEYSRIGEWIYRNHPAFEDLRLAGATFVWLKSDRAKSNHTVPVLADVDTVPDKWKWCCPADFYITVYEPNVEEAMLDDEQIKVLLEHELRHCQVNDEKMEPQFYTVPHDLEEFHAIIDQFGVDWQSKPLKYTFEGMKGGD